MSAELPDCVDCGHLQVLHDEHRCYGWSGTCKCDTPKAVECTATVSAVDMRSCHVELTDVRWVTTPHRRDDAREVPVMSVYSPTVGDRVRVLNYGGDFLVLGLIDQGRRTDLKKD